MSWHPCWCWSAPAKKGGMPQGTPSWAEVSVELALIALTTEDSISPQAPGSWHRVHCLLQPPCRLVPKTKPPERPLGSSRVPCSPACWLWERCWQLGWSSWWPARHETHFKNAVSWCQHKNEKGRREEGGREGTKKRRISKTNRKLLGYPSFF